MAFLVRHWGSALKAIPGALAKTLLSTSSLIALTLFFGVAVGLQWLSGAYSAEFGGYPDEPAHYVTGLMIRDYLAAGMPAHPMKFAENYYLHYPKVALGWWGPVLHLVIGVWMLVFSCSRVSVLLLMASITSALAFTLYRVVEREFSFAAGVAAGVLLTSLPLVQASTGMVMADSLVALLAFWAALCFGRFLDTEKARYSILFGVFASLCILTKGNGMSLVFVPPLALFLSRRLHLLRRWAFWVPGLIVLVLAGPWQFIWVPVLPTRSLTWGFIWAFLRSMVRLLGLWLFPLIAMGVLTRIIAPFRRKAVTGAWTAAAGLWIGVWVFHAVSPWAMVEARLLILAVAPAVMFLVASLAWVAARLPLPGLSYPHKAALAGLLAALIFAAESFAIPPKYYHGFTELAQVLLARSELRSSVFLISSQAGGEGLFISEVAIREPRPGHVILRASKVLGQSDWAGRNYRLLQRSPEEVMTYLESIPVRVVVVDLEPGPRQVPHHLQLIQTLKRYSERWEFLGRYPQQRPATAPKAGTEVYRLKGAERPKGKIRIDLPYTLGRSIER